jgi:acyl carrier protein
MPASDETYARVTNVLVQSLGVDEDDITPSATLLGDLGAESIDFLDIVFRLERTFGIKIPRGELFIEPAFQGATEYMRDGRVTAEGLVALRALMPYADLADLERGGRLSNITDLFTVDLVIRYLTWKLDGGVADSPGLSAGRTDSVPLAVRS